MANRRYYTLLVHEAGKWMIAFGDYSKAVVKQELIDAYPGFNHRGHSKIITTGAIRISRAMEQPQ